MRPPEASSAERSRSPAPSPAWLPRLRARPPIVECRIADSVLAAQIGRLHPGLVLLQDHNDLLFRVPFALHHLGPSPRPRLQFVLDQFKGATSAADEVAPLAAQASRRHRRQPVELVRRRSQTGTGHCQPASISFVLISAFARSITPLAELVVADVRRAGRLQLVGRAASADHRSDCNNSGGYVFIRVKLMIIHDCAKYFSEIHI